MNKITHLSHYLIRYLLAVITFGVIGFSITAEAAPVCGPEIKETIAKTLSAADATSPAEKLKVEATLYQQYSYCMADAGLVTSADPLIGGVRQCNAKLSALGSTYFEEMACCGYDPQRRTFACPVKVKQGFGFGGTPLPGSREYVLNCVADTAGVFQPVGVDSVHLSNSTLVPTWQFAVVANANNNLHLVQPMNGATRTARSILSWNFQPTNCNYRPIWGNSIDYRIRLDQ